MTIRDVARELESLAPLALKEDFDNVGLLIGDDNWSVSSILITLDITEEVMQEAIDKACNLIVAHHPIMLSGVKKITGRNYTERIIQMAIKNDIAIYAAHTNLDSVQGGVSNRICEKLNLSNCNILAPRQNSLLKLTTFVPNSYADVVRKAIFSAGAGVIGNYDSCSYNLEGEGTFRGNDTTNPFVGEKGKLHFEPETRIETILPRHIKGAVIKTLIKAHPYEEVAYDLYPLENEWPTAGFGMIGELDTPVSEENFLSSVKSIFKTGCIRHTQFLNKPIKTVAVCGGSGSFLLNRAIASGADIFITGDFKYHQFFDAENKILIADIGHFESEQFTKEVFFELLTKKFSNFAIHLSNVNTNPVKYF
ncbi:Nif3-like dinuclear metal center hexameric protein [Marinilabiliaceae bacterium JC017]|nr:Nif3-like dinuclear metal center hexameric protein [Marinilabiliaceae bacterium JC017]